MSSKPSLSAGVVVTRRERGRRLYLLLRVFGYWDFPKGGVEPGETPLAGAIREVEEESGVTRLDFQWGETFRETPPYGRGKVARYYVAETDQAQVFLRVNPELGHPEHDEYRWVTYSQARRLLNDRVRAILDWANATMDHT